MRVLLQCLNRFRPLRPAPCTGIGALAFHTGLRLTCHLAFVPCVAEGVELTLADGTTDRTFLFNFSLGFAVGFNFGT